MRKRIPVPEYITGTCPPDMGFTERRVEQVCKKPDAKHVIQHDDLSLQLVVKHELNWSDLVLLRIAPTRQVSFACRLLPDLCDSPLSTIEPLQLLKAFIARFGLTLKIGSFEGVLLFNEKIPLVEGPPTNLVDVINPENHSILVVQHIRITRDRVADIAFAFAVDTELYASWHGK